METAAFEFRVCQNPECGLRYPTSRGNKRGVRCPACLGNTIVETTSNAARGSESASAPPLPAGRLPAVIDNVRAALNVGAIFRSAEGMGISHLYLCGITPAGDNPAAKKTALGAEHMVRWSAHKNAVELVKRLKAEGACIWALERTTNSKGLIAVVRENIGSNDRVLVVGNEQAGVDPGILEFADEVLHLEMQGQKRSFNVAVAFAIAAHELTRSRN